MTKILDGLKIGAIILVNLVILPIIGIWTLGSCLIIRCWFKCKKKYEILLDGLNRSEEGGRDG